LQLQMWVRRGISGVGGDMGALEKQEDRQAGRVNDMSVGYGQSNYLKGHNSQRNSSNAEAQTVQIVVVHS
jgi:hypothetical protein